ncbi:MAG: MarR family transcriptional regulator [Acidiphilium sp. 37-64-53]|uniref:MarR family winged helix-turn-helix transcriptional regulator n=1 Tax=Acidiphilium sp. 37-64-53 TaxID=1970299 RepID=UPI000BC6F2F6|nr:MarR family transcriptional regulator [Acidiphilium sp. 37-64-53]OYV58176.1 MAG: MarR family transcriptional regulator [Acidiphilium sp. 21-62-4]OYW00595.1 MAG: MarR family transcriptional regulator [Acidiphilium sp. 37-64-53]HQT89533.1 MarR family transcriptional regulator [Acidiphilium sp.]
MHEKRTQSTPTVVLLFLCEEEIRLIQDMIFLANRDLMASADTLLAETGFGRAHHRTLHFIARDPGLPVGELLHILSITKQSLTRVLGPLIRQGYVEQTPGRTDRRQRMLSLTKTGATLERQLFKLQHERLTTAFSEVGGPAVEGFRKVLRGMMKEEARQWLDRGDERV